jgi:hypothetical protein
MLMQVTAPLGLASVPIRVKVSESDVTAKSPVKQVRTTACGSLVPFIRLLEGDHPLVPMFPR